MSLKDDEDRPVSPIDLSIMEVQHCERTIKESDSTLDRMSAALMIVPNIVVVLVQLIPLLIVAGMIHAGRRVWEVIK